MSTERAGVVDLLCDTKLAICQVAALLNRQDVSLGGCLDKTAEEAHDAQMAGTPSTAGKQMHLHCQRQK